MLIKLAIAYFNTHTHTQNATHLDELVNNTDYRMHVLNAKPPVENILEAITKQTLKHLFESASYRDLLFH